MSPAQAMQPPAPPSYRPALMERMGLGRMVGPSGKMIVRNIERRLGRAAVVVMGVAASIAIIISGSFWGDAVDWFVDLQFRATQAGDAAKHAHGDVQLGRECVLVQLAPDRVREHVREDAVPMLVEMTAADARAEAE